MVVGRIVMVLNRGDSPSVCFVKAGDAIELDSAAAASATAAAAARAAS